jgi:hypothetical protein
MGRVLEVLQSLGANSNSDVYVITVISIHLSPGKLQTDTTTILVLVPHMLYSVDKVD